MKTLETRMNRNSTNNMTDNIMLVSDNPGIKDFSEEKNAQCITGTCRPVNVDLAFRSYYELLCRYASEIINNKQAAQEIVQDLFTRIWEAGDSFIIHSSLKSYLFKSVHNRCLNYFRDTSKKKYISSDDPLSRNYLINIQIKPEIIEKLFSEDTERTLKRAFGSLPQSCRDIFIMCRFKNMSYQEIAEKLNISLSTVKTQMWRAMHKLHEAVKEQILL